MLLTPLIVGSSRFMDAVRNGQAAEGDPRSGQGRIYMPHGSAHWSAERPRAGDGIHGDSDFNSQVQSARDVGGGCWRLNVGRADSWDRRPATCHPHCAAAVQTAAALCASCSVGKSSLAKFSVGHHVRLSGHMPVSPLQARRTSHSSGSALRRRVPGTK